MKTTIKHSSSAYIRLDDGVIHADNSTFFGTCIQMKKRTAHWERFGNGSLTMDLQANTVGHWLSFDITEAGEKSSKRVMFALQDKAQLQRLRDMIDLAMGDES